MAAGISGIITYLYKMNWKTKNTIINIIVNTFVLVIIYLFFSACAWGFNPAHWGGFTRFLCALFMLITIVKDID